MPTAIRHALTLLLGLSLLAVSAQLLTNASGSFGFQSLSAPGTADLLSSATDPKLSEGDPATDLQPGSTTIDETKTGNLADGSVGADGQTAPPLSGPEAANNTGTVVASGNTDSTPAAPAANSVASITAQLQQVDPFIEDLAATNSAAGSASDSAATELVDANDASSAADSEPREIPVVDHSTQATDATIARFAQLAAASAAGNSGTPQEGESDEESEDETEDANAFEMLGERIRSGTRKQLTWNATETLSGSAIPTPVLVVHGADKGPVMCITAGVHGDELNGIETVRRILHSTKPEKLKGTLVGVPIVNLQGFQRQSRYLPDRRDLNRFFPGHPRGSSASRIAHSFFDGVIRHCDALVDLHTGSFHRTNLPQLRADLNNESVVELSQSFGSTVVLHSEGGVGTLRRAAVEAGIPAVTLEAGEPLRLQSDEVAHSVKGINTLLATRGMYKRRNIWGASEAVYYTSQWVRADTGGILFSQVDLGKRIADGELLGTVTDPVSNEREEIRAPYPGRVIGMALNQFVMPGFATFHIGIEAESVNEATDDVDPTILSHDVAFEPDMSVDGLDATEPTEE